MKPCTNGEGRAKNNYSEAGSDFGLRSAVGLLGPWCGAKASPWSNEERIACGAESDEGVLGGCSGDDHERDGKDYFLP
jgi:hypothetical protein